MKKIIYTIATITLVLILAVGCTNDQESPNDVDGETDIDESTQDSEQVEQNGKDERSSEEIIEGFEDEIGKSLTDAGNFIEKNMNELSEVEADKMVSKLMEETEESVDEVRNRISDLGKDQEIMDSFGSGLYLSQDQINQMDDDQLKEEINRLQDENYRLANLEGQYYPIVDYEEFKRYDEYVSSEISDYIDLKSKDSDKPVAIDAALNVSYEELAGRILETENYIKKYGEGNRYGDVLNMYETKLEAYLLGTPNTPITKESSDKIKEDLMDSYREAALNRDSATGFIVGKYVKEIEENNGVIDDAIKNEGELLLEEAIELISTGK